LRTSIYFEGVDLVEQKVREKSALGLPHIEFKLNSVMNYYPNGYPPLAAPVAGGH
jgi:hypothetical protein